MRAHRVRALLMGGQACVFYGAAEFSRDTDFAILADAANLARLRKALAELRAEPIAVPPFELKFLKRGHALHFRCQHPEALRMRVDVMSKMRGVDSFSKLWRRRTTIALPDGTKCDLLSLPDLVQAKKTQRDKDWPMIRRLVEAHYFANHPKPSAPQIKFWLMELRTPQLLLEVAQAHVSLARQLAAKRPLLRLAVAGRLAQLENALAKEENNLRAVDKTYWRPLMAELEKLRHPKYAWREYGLTPAELAKAAKLISAEIKAARKRGEVTRFTPPKKHGKPSD
jgi:hypothetical protein